MITWHVTAIADAAYCSSRSTMRRECGNSAALYVNHVTATAGTNDCIRSLVRVSYCVQLTRTFLGKLKLHYNG
jgi:hypothetical protein